MDYQDFLARKRSSVPDVGVSVGELHPALYDFQSLVVQWALRKGRAGIFADCGLGKTLMQCEWARQIADTVLIVAPLSVARQTVREARIIGLDVTYVRNAESVAGPGVWITNYEMVDRFEPSSFGAVVLDESSILKNVDSITRKKLTDQFASIPYRLACTATPAPNDVAELTNHAEFLGAMTRREMLSSYFIHDQNGWRLKGHAAEPMYEWMASWACAFRRPSDLGFSDEGFDLPPLSIIPEIVSAPVEAGNGQLFATNLGGVGGRAQVRRQTMGPRVERTAALASSEGQWIVWCGLNDEAKAVAKSIGGSVNVEGSWKPERKAEALEAFQDGDIRVLVTKPSIAGFGMNFQNCSNMAFLGLSDSYESYFQSIRRCYRYGQTTPVNAHIVLSEIEEQIATNVRRKEAEAAHTTDRLIAHVARELQEAA